ncbi:P-loop ATPase, Sll1717 family [Glycomyces tenuis]|uniref:P-loop ATPase, Sll1717 family n=1 Tax=Glycomyces tenuis TaxID=58116 RepID=UPI0012DCF8A1|nr:hypothetical protein [Glycomyces tenuis]
MGRNFKSLYFGEIAAEDEAEKWPKMFVDGFYDLRNVSSSIREGNTLLLIGPKGAGKSSYIEYLKLSAENQQSQFIKREDLSELRGAWKTDRLLDESGSEISENAWSVWIWCRIFKSLMDDAASSLHSDPSIGQLYRQLQAAGIVEGDFPSIVKEVRLRRHKFSIPKIYEYSTENTGSSSMNLLHLRDTLASIVSEARTPNTHILALDGLDSAEIGSNSYWKQLASLLRSSAGIHRRLRNSSSVIRLCLLCRVDVFLRIPIADSNKIRQSWGTELNWSDGLDTPEDSSLWDLLESKASARGPNISNLVDTYFPNVMEVGQRGEKPRHIFMPKYLIDLTRNTPRDVIMLMKSIQSQILPDQSLSVKRIRAGANSYCQNYFVNEISNELVGMLPQDVSAGVIGSMSRLPGRGFSRDQFTKVFSSLASEADTSIDKLLTQLYLAGAIANVRRSSDSEYVRFYHRRNFAEIDLEGPFILHNALALALNLHWTRAYER